MSLVKHFRDMLLTDNTEDNIVEPMTTSVGRFLHAVI